MDKKKLFAEMIGLARMAPLQNMAHAEAVAKVIQEFAQYAQKEIDQDEAGQELSPE